MIVCMACGERVEDFTHVCKGPKIVPSNKISFHARSRRMVVKMDGLELVVLTNEVRDDQKITSVKLAGQEIGAYLNNDTYNKIWKFIEASE